MHAISARSQAAASASASARGARVVARAAPPQQQQPQQQQQPPAEQRPPPATRRALLAAAALAAAAAAPRAARATSLPEETAPAPLLCDAACAAALERPGAPELVTTPSGLQYREIVVGTGPKPSVGFQVVCDYIAMTPAGRVFANSLDNGKPYDVRVGAGQVIPGLDEGLLSMRVGGVRRLYIPGGLAFPKGLKAAAGRPSVPPGSPVVFDVALRYIPGLEEDE